MQRKTVSVSSELQLLIDGARGVHALTRRFIDSFGMETELPESISALLVIMIERLRLMDRAVRGTVDPHLVYCVENDASRSANPSEEDLVLTEWSERRLARHHRAQWKRARTRMRSAKPAKREPQP
jgi:hypothetical protein